MDETLLKESIVDKVPRTSLVDGLVNFEADEATSKIVDDRAPAVRGRLTEIEPGKRKSKPVKRWLAYQTSQLEGRRRKLHMLLSKSRAVDELLYSVRNVEAVREQILQIDGVFKMLIEVHREYNYLLLLEMQDQDKDWFDHIDEKNDSKIRSATG